MMILIALFLLAFGAFGAICFPFLVLDRTCNLNQRLKDHNAKQRAKKRFLGIRVGTWVVLLIMASPFIIVFISEKL